MKIRLLFFTVTALLIFCICTSCSKNIQLSGQVTYSDDGSPLTTGIVCFETNTYMARGNLKPDGTYTITSVTQNDGLPPGQYRVSVLNAIEGFGEDNATNIPLIDPKYGDSNTSGITFQVTPSSNRFDFTVERYKANQ
ncbi:MAG: hypothetical protein LBE18_06025 [Planctomycetaceae bacterium]|jgi:hypothetical protein|nr:hypothetical protein [Planctomycetaceae bacterium]